MLKATKSDVREEIQTCIATGRKYRYVVDEYAMYSAINITDYFIEKRGSLKSGFFFDKKMAYEDLKSKWNTLIKKIAHEEGIPDYTDTDMSPRRFEMVFNVKEMV
jgi:hypothetical protein